MFHQQVAFRTRRAFPGENDQAIAGQDGSRTEQPLGLCVTGRMDDALLDETRSTLLLDNYAAVQFKPARLRQVTQAMSVDGAARLRDNYIWRDGLVN